MATIKAKAVSTEFVGKVRKEKNANVRLEAMQIKVLGGIATLRSKMHQALEREVQRFLKNRASLITLKQEPIGNFTVLRELYNALGKDVTQEAIAVEFAAKAERFKLSFLSELTAEQSEVIDQAFALDAMKMWGVVKSAGAILAIAEGKAKEAQAILVASAKEVSEPAAEAVAG